MGVNTVPQGIQFNMSQYLTELHHLELMRGRNFGRLLTSCLVYLEFTPFFHSLERKQELSY